jgi:membrane-associated phospholipid phosphatase
VKQKIAAWISLMAHPLITISIFILVVMFSYEAFNKALFISFLLVGGVIIPSTIRNYLKTKNGEYTNFDVSVRSQRNSMYIFAITLLVIISGVLFVTKQSEGLFFGALFALFLLIVSYLVNFFIKCSGHVSLTIYLAFLIMPINLLLGISVLLFSGLIGWSRVELKRHTPKEVYTGAIIGFTIGLLMLVTESFV